jgi:hypothetical protein
MQQLEKAVRLGLSALALVGLPSMSAADGPLEGSHGIKHVLLISIDGMHAVDFQNCSNGLPGVKDGQPYCPNLATLSSSGVVYTHASTAKPSDSFPGSGALATGGLPATIGMYYDVSYDRALSPPRKTTPYGLVGGPNLCPAVIGYAVAFDEEIDKNYTLLNGGGGIDPDYLPRDPFNGCQPVYPHQYIRSNTVFEVVKAKGGYTAWSDKHPAYDFYNGPSGKGVDDFYSPEINSVVVPLTSVHGCSPIPDPNSDLTAWTNSFANVRCYDAYKVNIILNELAGKNHDGSKSAPVPALFGMNFQAVSVGEKLVENKVAGGYVDAVGTPSTNLLNQIEFVDASIGKVVEGLKTHGLYESTLIVITAKHGQSPIDPKRVLRIPADNASLQSPATLLGSLVAGSSEDDISLIWLADQSTTADATTMLEDNLNRTGGGEIFSGPAITAFFDDPAVDPRTPDIAVEPNVGVIYTGGKKKISEHGGFAHDDTNVVMLVANPKLAPKFVAEPVQTTQVAPTILEVLGISPSNLQAVVRDHTVVLPGLSFTNNTLPY